MKFPFINKKSPLFPFRWFMVWFLLAIAFMFYHHLLGGRVFNRNAQQTWSSSGPGYHK